MSRKRYSSGSQRWSPNQGKQKSTSTQLASQDDSLTAECLIRTFMEKGNMEDPILKVLFIGGSKPRENETEKDLLFRRMKNCWMEKGKGYGMKELLKTQMKMVGIETEIDGRWAKFQLMGAPLIINPKIWVNKPGEERRFLKDFQLEKFRDDRTLSEATVRIKKYGYISTVPELIGYKIIVHKWDQFPDENPIVLGDCSKKAFHFIIDDCEILHHVIINGGQQGILDQYYKYDQRESIQLVQQDWSKYICMVRGKQRIFQTQERKKKTRENSVESEMVHEMFQQLRRKQEEEQGLQRINKEEMSDQDSQRSRGEEKKSKMNDSVLDQEWRLANERVILDDIMEIERALNLALAMNPNDKNLIPKEVFPNGVTKFAEENGVSNFLKFYLKLSYDYLTLPTRKDENRYNYDRDTEMRSIKKGIINELNFELDRGSAINNLTHGLILLLDTYYEKSGVVMYADFSQEVQNKVIELTIHEQGIRQRYYKVIKEENREDVKKVANRLNKMLKNPGLVRLTIDQFMVCPFCIRTFEKKEIFKHSCLMRVDLMQIKRGRRQ